MDEWVRDQSLEQGTDAWKAARKRRIGGSDIAAVMRLSPYKTRRRLWEEMTGRRAVEDISRLPHVQRGIKAEAIARGMLERRYGVKYARPVLVHPEHPWAVASLDGLAHDHTMEIKTMSLEKHIAARGGVIPVYYEAQIQWGMMIAGKDKCLFASYRPEDYTLYERWVEAEPEWQAEMLITAMEFMRFVEDDKLPEDYEYVG
jgi:putative phage-type endonuclease